MLGVLHRDLKSRNLLVSTLMLKSLVNVAQVDKINTIKVCDFGLSKVYKDPNDTGNDFYSLSFFGTFRNTLNAGGVGTTAWMAPEVINHKQYSYSADVYSFGTL